MSDASNPADAAARLMQDFWKAFTPPADAGTGATAAASFVPTPETMRSMQNAFLSSLEDMADRMMRTPQFLDAMQKGMKESLAMQQQLRSYLQSNLDQSMGAAGASGAGADGTVVAALHRMERTLDRMDERLRTLEQHVAASGAPAGADGGKDGSA